MSIYSDVLGAVNEAAKTINAKGQSQFKREEVEEWIKQNRRADWERFAPSFQVTFSTLTTQDPVIGDN